MKIAYLLPALGLLAAMAFRPETPISAPSSNPSAPASEAAVAPPPAMRTATSVVYKGEMLTLDFSLPHASYLGVTDPKGRFFYVIYPMSDAFEGLRPLVSSESFAKMKQIKIDTRTFAADPYTYGVNQNQPVFTQSGKYTFVLGENLHVDDPALVTKLTVEYHHSDRPGQNASVAVR